MRAQVEARLAQLRAAMQQTQQALAQCEERRQALLQVLLQQHGGMAALESLLEASQGLEVSADGVSADRGS